MERKTKRISYDDLEGIIQLFNIAVLTAVVRGEIDLNRLAREELMQRGLDRRGEWVGFHKAREIFEAENNPAAQALRRAAAFLQHSERIIVFPAFKAEVERTAEHIERIRKAAAIIGQSEELETVYSLHSRWLGELVDYLAERIE